MIHVQSFIFIMEMRICSKENRIRLYRFMTGGLSIQPDHVDVLHQKANLLDTIGRYDEALACYDSALECDPQNAEIWYNKGMTPKKTGCTDESQECINHGLSMAMGKQ